MRRSVLLGFVLLGLVLGNVVAILNTSTLFWQDSHIVRTLAVHEALDDVHSVPTTAESRQLRFLLTGDQTYLMPAHDATRTIDNTLRRLPQLTAGSPDHLQRLADFEAVIRQRLAAIHALAARRQAHAAELQHDLRLADEARTRITELAHEERLLLQVRKVEAQVGAGRNAPCQAAPHCWASPR
jgi:CHASE3 domain sensor protein